MGFAVCLAAKDHSRCRPARAPIDDDMAGHGGDCAVAAPVLDDRFDVDAADSLSPIEQDEKAITIVIVAT
ncbi:hypothetical protein HZF05_01445 [Sphingomonas sp. CGMCC 1.13654]|uniref:Uncharacterized protein n=1 Tax=Sphingomonas chungangi TaxID=2683589 RepID=A0A838L2V1_9SPHN|nr:hypothetical protein [Sphingomonas chungangi]MBA2932749.1 hypothetical protein [Sphingomonas chungangi]MVW56371.1 hypothetical protein [Sphingomonas chungangi]